MKNFTWGAAYNVLAVLLAAGAFIRVQWSPQFAGLGEAVNVLPMIIVPLRLRWGKYLRSVTSNGTGTHQ